MPWTNASGRISAPKATAAGRYVVSIDTFAPFRQPWWHEPHDTQACRRPWCSWCRSSVVRATGASVAVMPTAAAPRIIMSDDAFRPGGRIEYRRDGSHG